MKEIQLYLDKIDKRKELRPLVILSGFSIALLLARMLRIGNIQYIFLGWNLILAWVPWLLAKQLQKRNDPPRLLYMPYAVASIWQKVSFIGLSTIWLLFFPNAPYLISDLIHLHGNHSPVAWYDAVMLFSFGLSGLYIGLVALRLMSGVWRRVMPALLHRPLGLLVIWLSGLGIYMGRDLRFNSWELFTNPYELFHDTLLQLDFHACCMASLYAGLIGMCYWAFVVGEDTDNGRFE